MVWLLFFFTLDKAISTETLLTFVYNVNPWPPLGICEPMPPPTPPSSFSAQVCLVLMSGFPWLHSACTWKKALAASRWVQSAGSRSMVKRATCWGFCWSRLQNCCFPLPFVWEKLKNKTGRTFRYCRSASHTCTRTYTHSHTPTYTHNHTCARTPTHTPTHNNDKKQNKNNKNTAKQTA